MVHKVCGAIFALSLVAGCASAPKYVAGTSDTAQVRLSVEKGNTPENLIGDTMTVSLVDLNGCDNKTLVDLVYTTSPPKTPKPGKLGMPLPRFAQGSMHEFELDAGSTHQLVVEFRNLVGGALGTIYKCNIAFERDFEIGGQYELHGEFIEHGRCQVALNQIVTEGDTPRRDELAVFSQATHPAPEACVSN